MQVVIKGLLLAAGAALFAWFVGRVGLEGLGAALAPLGWAAPLVLAPYFVVYMIDALAWRWTFAGPLTVGFPSLWGIRWCGEAVNGLVPSAYVGGEAVKVLLLKRRGVDAARGTAAAMVSKSAQTLAQLLFLCAAATAFLRLAPDRPELRAGLVVVLGGGLASVFALFWIQSRGMYATLRQVMSWGRWRPQWLEASRQRIEGLDAAITSFYQVHRRRFLASTVTYLAGWFLDTLEIYLVAHLLGQPMIWRQAFVVEAFVGVAKVLGMAIPGSLGVQEGGVLLVGRAVGLPEPFCLAYAVLRRARELVFIGFGLMLLYGEGINLGRLRSMSRSTDL